MSRVVSLLALVAVATALSAAPDPLLFIRDGKVMLLPANSDTPQQVIADDPGWTYATPTWLGDDQAVVLRLKDGQTGHSLVGIVPSLKTLPVKPTELTWLKAAAGCRDLGVRPSDRRIGFTKLATQADGSFELFYTLLSTTFVPGPAQRIYGDETGDIGGPPRRLQYAVEGDGVALPLFVSDASSPLQVFAPTVGKVLAPRWLDWHWLQGQKVDPAVTAVAWLPNHTLAMGTRSRGIYRYEDATQSIRAWDTWPAAGTVTELAATSDGKRLYYAYESHGAGGESVSEIRSLDPNGTHTLLLRNASDPAVPLAAG